MDRVEAGYRLPAPVVCCLFLFIFSDQVAIFSLSTIRCVHSTVFIRLNGLNCFSLLSCSAQKCPKIVHGIMMDCWNQDRTQRPKFEEILRRLEDLIRTPEMLNDDLVCYTR